MGGALLVLLLLEPVLLARRDIAWGRFARRTALILGAVILALGAWTLRRYLLTGHVFDPALAGPQSVDALSRQAGLADKLLLPIMPLVLGFAGSGGAWCSWPTRITGFSEPAHAFAGERPSPVCAGKDLEIARQAREAAETRQPR